MNDPYETLKKPDPIQAGRWHEMNVLELQDQRLLLSERFNTIALMIDGNAPLSYTMMRDSLSIAINDLDILIQQKQRASNDRHNK